MKDLVFTCDNGEKSIYCAYNTVMDFLDEVDDNKASPNVLNATNFKATFLKISLILIIVIALQVFTITVTTLSHNYNNDIIS